MSYEVQIRHTADSGSGISVEALVEGEPVAHTFPKNAGYFEERKGKPQFVKKLEEKYEEKMKRQGKMSVQDTSTEEAKIHSGHFENKFYGDTEKVKQNQDEKDTMADVDTDSPDEIRRYLKENMAEGYLSEEEGLNIDQFVDEYEELLGMKQNLEQVVREIYEGKVQ